jgi:type I restriction-modification system DNA methylase subunit
LFEEEYKDRETTPLPLENNLFKAIVDAFDTYNFTIDENDPMDQEIAVDPEMLGKIFEYMISINSEKIDALVELYNAKKKFKEYPSPDRSVNIVAEIKKNKEINKKLGAFYTPREIVHYMTREALIYSMIEFLSKKLTDKSREELEAIVRELRHCKDKHLTTKDEIEDRE